jgi:hypothetical protein
VWPAVKRAAGDAPGRESRKPGPLLRAALIAICCLLAAVLVFFVYRPSVPEWTRVLVALMVFTIGTLVLRAAFPDSSQLPAVAAAVLTLLATLPQASGAPPQPATTTRSVRVPWATCPHTEKPIGMQDSGIQLLATPPTRPPAGLGAAHIDNVISPDGSGEIRKQETICLHVTQPPAHGRMLWLMLVLPQPSVHRTHYLYFAVGAFGYPKPGPYPVSISRSCSAVRRGSSYNLMVVSAPAAAQHWMWDNYDARIRSAATDCNSSYDKYREALPPGTYRVSEQVDVTQH